MLAAGNFASYSQFSATYSTLDLTRSPLAHKGVWHLLPIHPAYLPSAAKHFDRAELGVSFGRSLQWRGYTAGWQTINKGVHRIKP